MKVRLAPPENTYLSFLMLIFLGIGFLWTHYYSAHASRFTQPIYSTDEILRTRGLSHRLHRLEYQNAHLASQISELNLQNVHEDRSLLEAHRLARFTGLVTQEGPGLSLTLKDSTRPLLLGDNANTGIIHNTDLLQVINELRSHGAVAVAVNNQPVMSMTAITCAGPIIMMNSSRITSPFLIEALGDAPRMQAALRRSSSFVHELKGYGIQAAWTPNQHVVIPAYSQNSLAF